MAHFVICKYCGQRFNRDIEPFVKIGERRYAHKLCSDQVDAAIPQEEKDYAKLEEYIKKLFNIDNLNIKIRKQIMEFHKEYNYTYTGILKTLYWWYEIKDHTTDLANEGIGIVPYIYSDAEKYFYNIYLAKLVNDQIGTYRPKIQTVEIASPRVRLGKKKTFKIEDE